MAHVHRPVRLGLLVAIAAAVWVGATTSSPAADAPTATKPTTQNAATQNVTTQRAAPGTPAELFDGTAVWTIHLTFAPDQWAAMEPKAAKRSVFSPSMFLAPAFLRDGDADGDGKIARDEFCTLGGRWFDAWDKAKAGAVDAEQLRAGLNVSFAPPGQPGGVGVNLQGSEGKRNGLASAVGIEFAYVRADLEFEGKPVKDVGVRYKGNGTFLESRGSLKRSIKIDVNRNAKDQKLAGTTTLNLHNCVTDASWMNEVLSHRLYRDAGVPAPRTAYSRVYVTVAGKHDRQYLGLYSVVEEVGKSFARDRFKTDDGAILKPVTPDLFAHLGDDWARYQQTYDPKTDLTDAQKKRVIEFAKLVSQATDEEFAAKVGDYLDAEQFARYMAVTTCLSTLDGVLVSGQNFYLYLDPRTNRFQFVPWDLDHSFGQFPLTGTQEQRERLSVDKPWRGANRFLERAFKVEAIRSLYKAKLAEFAGTVFKPERIAAQVDELAAAIRPAVLDESAQLLARFDKVVAGQSVGPRGGGGMFGQTKPIKPFVVARWRSVSEQLAGTAKGMTLDDGGRGGGGPGVGMFLGPVVMAAFDADKDGKLTRTETVAGFEMWFDMWDADKAGALTADQLRAGIDRGFVPGGGRPGGPPPPVTRPAP